MDRIRNISIRERSGYTTFLNRVDQSILKSFGHVKRMDNGSLNRRICIPKVGGARREVDL